MKLFLERHAVLLVGFFVCIIIALSAVLTYEYRALASLRNLHESTSVDFDTAKRELSEKTKEYDNLIAGLTMLEQEYSLSKENGAELFDMLTKEKDKTEAFEEQISDMSSTVGKLDKLSRIDPELLMKYSKVYFLNEHYAPEKIALIATSSLLRPEKQEYLHAKVLPFLEDMFEAAEEDGISLKVVSAYRSFAEQKSLKNAYTVSYGSGANTFSADQGYSEHQLGTTVDIVDAQNGTLTGFNNTTAYTWLLENAYRYGFVLSYPEKNGYYIFEPWHWRFIGDKLARHLHREELSFYDVDQREIDSYLISIFD